MAEHPASSNSTSTLTAACHCGRVQIPLPSEPTKLNECRCTVCYKYGAIWAYYPRPNVVINTAGDAKIEKYIRADEGSDGDLSFNRCGHCGCMMFWYGEGQWAGPEHQMGINCRMLPEKDIEGIERKTGRK